MVFFRQLVLVIVLTAPGFGATAATTDNPACLLTPPRGPFAGAMESSPHPPTAESLPSNQGAWSTLITPGPQHRWDSKVGLVESLDGSLLLHGALGGPDGTMGYLNVIVLVDYVPAAAATINVWNTEREARLGRVAGFNARVGSEGKVFTFDIELPRLTVPIGMYREIQTLVWIDGGRADVRRWTVYAGPNPPAAVECIAAGEALPEMPGRTRLEADGRIVIRAPRPATLAVVPLRDMTPGEVQFVRIDEAKRGWSGKLGNGVDRVAVWEAPFTGPGTNWISSFWSVRAAAVLPLADRYP